MGAGNGGEPRNTAEQSTLYDVQSDLQMVFGGSLLAAKVPAPPSPDPDPSPIALARMGQRNVK
ncbi:hypothetical protein GCM10007301_27910 [Azorhizobium oxalatiphilum]|uniref:Uncharacterized protein n=1 Tax=Azorhizobium oxalatiphilum TaxID=980631 RepID=A0A917C2D1_9HYPH|nr:hypothetical protein GCM10007301_27910 [Azorhizobium oxalatiphilum]